MTATLRARDGELEERRRAMEAMEAEVRRAREALEDAGECRICFSAFDSGAHAQAALPLCGHVTCMACAQTVWASETRCCHVCGVAATTAPVQLFMGS